MEDQQAQFLRAAVSLYSGDLLEGWFQDWCLYHRERLQSIYLTMLDKLIAFCEFHHEYENGLALGEHLLRQDGAMVRLQLIWELKIRSTRPNRNKSDRLLRLILSRFHGNQETGPKDFSS